MKTLILPASDTKSLTHAVRLLRAGKIIAFPTDTVYGVGADGFNERAIEQLFITKERRRDKAIPYLLACADDLLLVAHDISKAAHILSAKFWPGALTLIVPATARVPKILIAGGNNVAVRVPDNATTRTLIDSMRVPLAATSANVSGARDPATAQEVWEQLNTRIPLILDGGATQGNVPSTVVDVTTHQPVVRRIGVIGVAEIERVLGNRVDVDRY